MTTIKDIAKAAGVSTATVSRVINDGPKVGETTRNKIRNIMAELGYTPNANARSLATRSSRIFGVVIPNINEPFFSSLSNSVQAVARENNMQLLLSTGQLTAETELQAIQLLIEHRCDTIVAHSKFLDDDTLVDLCRRTPGFVLMNRYIEAIADRCIWLDNIEGGRIAARHLLSLNHQQVAIIKSKYDIDDPYLRHDGFAEILQQAGLPSIAEKLVIADEPDLTGGERAAQQLIASGEPFTAVFVYNDAMAIGAISVFEDNGYRVPEDVSIVGFDDVLLAQYSRPKLTTLKYPIEQMAKHAARLAIALSKGNDAIPAQPVRYVPELVQRESVKPIQ